MLRGEVADVRVAERGRLRSSVARFARTLRPGEPCLTPWGARRECVRVMAQDEMVVGSVLGIPAVVERRRRRDACVLAAVRAGLHHDPPGKHEISHFLEHMLFRGAEGYPNPKRVIDEAGGQTFAHTEWDSVWIANHVPADQLSLAIDMTVRMVFQPLLPKDDFETEKKVVLEELKMNEVDPFCRLYRLCERNVLRSVPEMAWPGFERLRAIVQGITLEDMVSFHTSHYVACNAAFVVLADREPQQSLDLLGEALDKAHVSPGRRVEEISGATPRRCAGILHSVYETDQPYFAITGLTCPYDSRERTAVRVMDIYLCSSGSSVLQEEVRDKRGLAYDLLGMMEQTERYGALAVMVGTTRPQEALEAIWREISRLCSGDVDVDRVRRAQQHLGGRVLRESEDLYSWAPYVARPAMYGQHVGTVEEEAVAIASVTPADVVNAARTVFDASGVGLTVVGDLAPDAAIFSDPFPWSSGEYTRA
jgi:predicted Zn-dependent peptidase